MSLPHAQPETDEGPAWGPMEWDLLLMRIEARRVVPIIGPDLVRITPSPADMAAWGKPDGPLSMESYLALRLADQWFKSRKHPVIGPQDLPDRPRLNDFICLYLDRGGSRDGLDQFYGHVAAHFARTRTVTDPAEELLPGSIRLPETLAQLAEITDFGLFLTTTGDTLLEQVIRRVRPDARLVTPSPGFSNERPLDLPPEAGAEKTPVVYHLFGQFGVESRSFALTEDDLLDFVVSLQSRSHSLGRLSDVMRTNQLLLLGGGFPDWLARFVMRTAKPRLLTAEDIVADEVASTDGSLCRFLQRFSPRTTVLPGGSEAFVATLHQRWQERRNPGRPVSPTAETLLAPVMPPKVAFISYASENREFALRLRQRLKEAGVEAWYDREQLEEGDNWDAKIRLNVQRCVLFLPLLSRQTEGRMEGYFRREWKAAAVRCDSIDDSVPFILPLLVDHDLDPATVLRVPREFRVPQWGACPVGGEIPESYVARIKAAYDLWVAHP